MAIEELKITNMDTTPFEIKILALHWVQYKDDPTDLCAHGQIYVRIADEVIADKKDTGGDWTLSSTALFLLRTLDRDYTPGDFYSQLVPHCGFNMFPEKDGKSVTIGGCPSGLDCISDMQEILYGILLIVERKL